MTDLCKVCGSTDIDDYGCITCFMLASAASWEDEENWEKDE